MRTWRTKLDRLWLPKSSTVDPYREHRIDAQVGADEHAMMPKCLRCSRRSDHRVSVATVAIVGKGQRNKRHYIDVKATCHGEEEVFRLEMIGEYGQGKTDSEIWADIAAVRSLPFFAPRTEH